MKRFLIACLLSLVAVPALAQKTPAPFVLQQYFDGNGDPYASAGMCVFSSGTSTLASSYTTSAGVTANANPLMMDSAGRPSSNGFFLTPGISYKLVFVNFTGVSVPSCSPINGVSVWTQDAIMATPASSGFIEIATATAGESIAAGDAVYLSDGQGARTAGRWYKTDADFTYASSEAPIVGVAPVAISSAATGTVVIDGLVTLAGPFTPGIAYFASATAGATTATTPTNPRVIGTAQSTTAFLVSPFNAYRLPSLSSANILNAVQLNVLACGRLTLTTGLPVTTADVLAATTIYYTPAGKCNGIGLYTTAAIWAARTLTEISIAVPATTATNYDVFVYDNAGTPALELSAAWNNSGAGTSARFAAGVYAALLPFQDGVRVKSTNGTVIDATRRYLGTFRTTGVSGQTESSFSKRLLWNHDNRVPLELRAPLETANTWNYSAATVRQANANTANQFEFVIGVADTPLNARVVGAARNGGLGGAVAISIGVDSITATTANQLGLGTETFSGTFVQVTSAIRVYPIIGYHYTAWLEWGDGGGGTFTWAGDNNTPSQFQSGISGEILG